MLTDYLFTKDKWVAINQFKFNKFLGVVILIGVYKSSNKNIAQFWSKEDGRPIFDKLMSRNRYQQILRVLRFDDANSKRRNRSEDKFQPIRDVIEQWDLDLRDAYTPGPHMTVDEQWWILGEANEAAISGPTFWSCRGAPLLKMACPVLGYFVVF